MLWPYFLLSPASFSFYLFNEQIGFDEELLTRFLNAANFCEVERVGNFNLMDDTSTLLFKGIPISLNVVGRICENSGGFAVNHKASPYIQVEFT